MQKLLISEKSALQTKEPKELLHQEWIIHAANSKCPEIITEAHRQANTKKTVQLLLSLGVSPNLTGYRCLLLAIPRVAENPGVMLKEIYPDIAKLCGLSDYRCVERTIRTALQNAWKNRDAAWDQYFPWNKERPKGKEFIARMAEEL